MQYFGNISRNCFTWACNAIIVISLWCYHNFLYLFLLLVTSVYAGFGVFSILGHMANLYKTPVEDVVTEGLWFCPIVIHLPPQTPCASLEAVTCISILCRICPGVHRIPKRSVHTARLQFLVFLVLFHAFYNRLGFHVCIGWWVWCTHWPNNTYRLRQIC